MKYLAHLDDHVAQFLGENPNCIFFDLETTGTDVSKDRIVSTAFVFWNPEAGDVHKEHWITDPGIPIPKEASDIHGITSDMVRGRPRFEALAPTILTILGLVSDPILCGYNIRRFDVPLLNEELLRAGLSGLSKDIPILDFYELWITRSPRKLENAVSNFTGFEIENAHDALGDTLHTIAAGAGMLKRYSEKIGENLSPTRAALELKKSEILDFAGNFIRNERGDIVFSFGKHKGKLAASEPGYLKWMKGADFTEDTKQIASLIQSGELA
jgi:DNA polymerase-3 subunit epsilon